MRIAQKFILERGYVVFEKLANRLAVNAVFCGVFADRFERGYFVFSKETCKLCVRASLVFSLDDIERLNAQKSVCAEGIVIRARELFVRRHFVENVLVKREIIGKHRVGVLQKQLAVLRVKKVLVRIVCRRKRA